MNKMRSTVTMFAAFVFTLAIASATQAAATRTFVDANGSDANVPNCTRALPCRTFQVAFNETLAGGEIVALSAAGYGGITSINKAIAITGAPGMPLNYVPGGTTSFTVNGAAADVIVLRNIQFNGRNEGTNTGVQFNSGKLIIQNCIFEFLTTGLSVAANTRSDVIDSSFHGNGTGIATTGNGTSVSNDANPHTMVRIAGGNNVGNTVGIHQTNPGDNKWAVWVYSPSNSATFAWQGNGTNGTCSATCNTAGAVQSYAFANPPL